MTEIAAVGVLAAVGMLAAVVLAAGIECILAGDPGIHRKGSECIRAAVDEFAAVPAQLDGVAGLDAVDELAAPARASTARAARAARSSAPP